MDIFNTPPDYINEQGTKWWLDDSTTQYATKPDDFGTKLDIKCYFVESNTGYRTRVLVDITGIIYDNQSLEAIGSKIEILKFLKRESS